MVRYSDNKKLRALKKEWDNKLKESGFKDIEYYLPNGEVDYKRKPRDTFKQDYPLFIFEIKSDYYSELVYLLEHHSDIFTPLEIEILNLHLQGLSRKQVQKALLITEYRVRATISKMDKIIKQRVRDQ